MSKLTIKSNLSPETVEKLLKLKDEAMLFQNDKAELTQKQDKDSDGDHDPSSQLPSSQKEKEASVPREIALQEKQDREKAKELFYKTKAWLESTFPKAINFKDPKPLKVGIANLLLVPSPYSKTQLRKCIGSYCASKAYLKAVIQGEWRYDLNGEKAEVITQENKDRAAKQLATRKNKFERRQPYPDKKGRAGGEEAHPGEGSSE